MKSELEKNPSVDKFQSVFQKNWRGYNFDVEKYKVIKAIIHSSHCYCKEVKLIFSLLQRAYKPRIQQ